MRRGLRAGRLLLALTLGCPSPVGIEDGGLEDALVDDAGVDGADAFMGLDGGPLPEPLPPCDVTPPAALFARPGRQEDGSFLSLDGRRAVAAGPTAVIEGFPTAAVVHPTQRVAYLVVASADDRRIDVVDLDTFAVLQRVERDDVFFGIAVAPDGSEVYVAAGASGDLVVYAVGADGTLTEAATVALDTYLAGAVITPDGATLYLAGFDESVVLEIDVASRSERRRIALPEGTHAWELALVPGREELYASDLRGESLTVLDLAAGSVAESIPLPVSPTGLAVRADGSAVYAAVSGSDSVVLIDPVTRGLVGTVQVGAGDLLNDAAGAPLPHSNVNALHYDDASDRLYASRGADNAVSVLDGTTLDPLGALPSDVYPTDVVLAPDGRTLVVTSGKGDGAGPGGRAKDQLRGTVAFVDLLGLDLDAETRRATSNFTRTVDLYAPDCEHFVVPTRPGQVSPIQYVILIVKENKTFDAILGDLDDPEVDADPSFNEWGLPYTPNHHALATQFAHSDNFYVLTPNSDTGHIALTATHLTEYAERFFLEDVHNGRFMTWPVSDGTVPERGNFFAHLHDHGRGVRIYGEIVGTQAVAADGTRMIRRSDMRFPGGFITNYTVRDEDKARYVARRIEAGALEPFTYLLLPNDHTNGTVPGTPTPESMVADNDYAMGLVVEALSRSVFWPRSVVFVVEDDPQGTADHVDAHRSVLHVISPWARRGYVSHVHTSYAAVFATIERILGVPPLGRPDAAAAPLYDMFTNTPDFTPYEAVERTYPYEINPEEVVGADASRRMDFRGPDRNEHLGELVRIYRGWRRGELTRDEAERRIDALDDRDEAHDEDHDEAVDEAAIDGAAFDAAYEAYREWAAEQGIETLPLRELPGAPLIRP